MQITIQQIQKDIFGNNYYPKVPKTEGIKYAGSKLKILPYILDIIADLDDVNTILDGFSGTTRVSQALAQLDYNVTTNDLSEWSEVFATCYLKADKSDKYYQDIINHLNSLKGYDGWYSANYGAPESGSGKPFQLKNTRKLDAIRDEIEKLKLDWEDKCVVLTSLIYALDSVDSTLGHYVSYLGKWSKRSYNDMNLRLPNRFGHNGQHRIIKSDIFNTLRKNNRYDLAYFDPPYGSNNDKMPPSRVRYSSYYHIWTTVIKNDRPEIFGKANRREDSRDLIAGSVFEEFRKDENGHHIAMNAIKKMFKEVKAKYVLLSYSSGGRATREELNSILQESGELLKVLEIDYKKNVMANMKWTNEWASKEDRHQEYLFLIRKFESN